MKQEIDLNIMSNSVGAVAWNFLSTQNFEYEIWHKKEQKKCYWLENDGQASVCFWPIKSVITADVT
jgi:hypothetical protein